MWLYLLDIKEYLEDPRAPSETFGLYAIQPRGRIIRPWTAVDALQRGIPAARRNMGPGKEWGIWKGEGDLLGEEKEIFGVLRVGHNNPLFLAIKPRVVLSENPIARIEVSPFLPFLSITF